MPKTDEQHAAAATHKEFVGTQLRLAREAMRLTQTKVSAAYHLGKSNKLNQWEAGRYYPDPYFLKRFCDDTGFTMDWFYRGLRAGVSSERVDDLRRAEAGSAAVAEAEVLPAA